MVIKFSRHAKASLTYHYIYTFLVAWLLSNEFVGLPISFPIITAVSIHLFVCITLLCVCNLYRDQV